MQRNKEKKEGNARQDVKFKLEFEMVGVKMALEGVAKYDDDINMFVVEVGDQKIRGAWSGAAIANAVSFFVGDV
jgi:hypothetical protein